MPYTRSVSRPAGSGGELIVAALARSPRDQVVEAAIEKRPPLSVDAGLSIGAFFGTDILLFCQAERVFWRRGDLLERLEGLRLEPPSILKFQPDPDPFRFCEVRDFPRDRPAV